jgi:hypothetical protein
MLLHALWSDWDRGPFLNGIYEGNFQTPRHSSGARLRQKFGGRNSSRSDRYSYFHRVRHSKEHDILYCPFTPTTHHSAFLVQIAFLPL